MIKCIVKVTPPICPYCNSASVLVGGNAIYPHRPDLYQLNFWQCAPCDAYVGCHKKGAHANGAISDGTLPLGRLADKALRTAKTKAHAAFDPLWKERRFKSRKRAYNWLAQELRITPHECHIGLFDLDLCRKVVDCCSKVRNASQ